MLMSICILYLIRSITYLRTLTRLSALIQWTDTIRLGNTRGNESTSSRQPIRTLGNQSELGSQSESSRQPIRLKHYVTRVVSQSESSITSPGLSTESSRRMGGLFRLLAPLGSLYLILIHRVSHSPPPSDQLTLLILKSTFVFPRYKKTFLVFHVRSVC